MWSASTFTLVFRGLMVFHRLEMPDGGSLFEIGVLPTQGHFLRISTIKNSVLAGVFPLAEHVRGDRPFWRLAVDNPVGGGVGVHTSGAEFRRLTRSDETGLHLMTDDERDFRWMTDLEGEEFYQRDLTNELDTSLLVPILRVSHGVFYTRLKSTEVLRKQGAGGDELFGSIAGAVACDIPILDGRVRVVEEGTNEVIFPFTLEPDTIYEFANTPPDIGGDHSMMTMQPLAAGIAPAAEAEGAAPEMGNMAEADATPPDPGEDHFQAYYRLFKDQNIERFHFTKPDAAPAPDPALCGSTMLGKRSAPLRAS